MLTPRPLLMPLKFDDPTAGRSDDEVRADRGEHLLHATGQCFKLSVALPTLAARVSDTECTVPLSLGLWLCLPMLSLDAAVRLELFHLSLVGPTRLGAVLELVLGDMEIDGPIPATVLRRRLLEKAALRRRADAMASPFHECDRPSHKVASPFPCVRAACSKRSTTVLMRE